MTSWWQNLTPGQQYGWGLVLVTAAIWLLCHAWQWVANGQDALDIALWEFEMEKHEHLVERETSTQPTFSGAITVTQLCECGAVVRTYTDYIL